MLSDLILGTMHRFNNQLIVIMGNASLIEANLPKDASDKTRQKLADIVEAAQAAAELVQELRRCAHEGLVAPAIQRAASEVEKSHVRSSDVVGA